MEIAVGLGTVLTSPLVSPSTGHTFTLTLNKEQWEYTYEPAESSTHLAPSSTFSSTMCFPDYMLSRFLTNLLNSTYSKP